MKKPERITPPDAAAIVEIEGVGKQYGPRWALREVSLTLRPGEIVGFIGPNGAGKTTLMKLMAGLTRASAGRLVVLGQRLDQGPLRAPEGLGVVLDEMGFVSRLSGRGNLEGLARLRGVATSRTVEETLLRVGLDPADVRPVRQWSLGMRQRLALAQALMEKPRLLLLDEPTNGLDPAGILALRTLLNGLAAEGVAIFLASHLLHEVEQSCHRVLLAKQGRLWREVAPGLLRTGVRLVVSGPSDADRVLDWARGHGREVAHLPDDSGRPVLRFPNDSVPAVIRELGALEVSIEEVTPSRVSLEELFLELESSRVPEA